MAALQGKPVQEEFPRGIRAYQGTMHPSIGESPNKIMFGRELHGKFPEVSRKVDQHNDNKIQKRNREQKGKMKAYADKQRHTAPSNIKVGNLIPAKQERKNSLTFC